MVIFSSYVCLPEGKLIITSHHLILKTNDLRGYGKPGSLLPEAADRQTLVAGRSMAWIMWAAMVLNLASWRCAPRRRT